MRTSVTVSASGEDRCAYGEGAGADAVCVAALHDSSVEVVGDGEANDMVEGEEADIEVGDGSSLGFESPVPGLGGNCSSL